MYLVLLTFNFNFLNLNHFVKLVRSSFIFSIQSAKFSLVIISKKVDIVFDRFSKLKFISSIIYKQFNSRLHLQYFNLNYIMCLLVTRPFSIFIALTFTFWFLTIFFKAFQISFGSISASKSWV
jgi:hypothetical protein